MLNERNKENKKLKDAAMKEKGIKRKSSGRKTDIDGDHPHGTHGEHRGAGRKPARKVGSITTRGRTGTTATATDDPRLVDQEGKRRKVATDILPNHTAGPRKKLPDHTVYHDMGMLMAESLGLVSEEKTKKPKGRFAHMQQTREKAASVDAAQREQARNETAANRKAIAAAGAKPPTESKPPTKSKPPSDGSIARFWRGPHGSKYGG